MTYVLRIQMFGAVLFLLGACTTEGADDGVLDSRVDELIERMDSEAPPHAFPDVPEAARQVLEATDLSTARDQAAAFERLASWLSAWGSYPVSSIEAEELVERLATPETDDAAYSWWCCGEWELWWNCFTGTSLCGYCAHGPGAC